MASDSSSFVVPVKKISLPVQLQQFHQSQTYTYFLNFVVVDLNDAVKHKKISEEGIRVISIVEKMLKALETCKEWVALYPPLQQTMRYGNKAFRSWFQHLVNVRLLFILLLVFLHFPIRCTSLFIANLFRQVHAAPF
jgi:hypothetical protein